MQSNPKLYVYPTSRSIREYISTQKEFNTLLPDIITIDEFFKRSLLLENKKVIDKEERFLYLKQAVLNIDLKKLGISSNFLHFIKQSDYIYNFFLELSSENVDIDSIDNVDTYGFYSEHLEILREIKSNYLNILDENNAVDKINISNYYEINHCFIKRYSSIEINFEGYFTSFEFELIKKISKLTKLNIVFSYNEFNEKSIEKFVQYGFDLKKDNKYLIDFTNKNIIKKLRLKKRIKELEIKGFSSRINQIAFIKSSIVNLVNKGVNPSKIALILPDESFTTTLGLYDKENYFNFAMGLNIFNSNLYKVADAISSYINEEEIKNKKNLEFLDLDISKIDFLFKENWNKNLTVELFENIIQYFIANESNKELIEKFKELVYKLYKLLFTYDEKILVKEAYKILLQKISKISLDDINSGKITVMGVLESRLIDFEGLIICDFNESLIPKRNLKDKFLSSKIKELSNLPTSIDRENLQKYYYNNLVNNSLYVYISYIKNDNEQISRFANTLFDRSIEEKVYDNEYKHILYSNNSLKHYDEEIILGLDLSKITWSASSLKEFLECKRKYYFNHILKIKEHDISLRPKGYELGNIVHESLEEYYKQDIRTYKKLLEIFDAKRSLNSFLNLDLEIWKRKLNDFLLKEEERFKDRYKILELEKPFLIEFEGIKLKGIIDRLDIKDDKYFVIDYKTSSSLKISNIKNYKDAVDFQLEFYYLAVESLYNTSNIKTFYYDLHNIKLLEESVLDEKLELLKEILEELKTSTVNFKKSEDNKVCQFCIYKTICKKD